MVGLRIAVRYLFAGKSHKAVNIISRISVAGVAVATCAIICVLSVFNGFSKISEERLSKLDPDLRVEAKNGKVIENADSLSGLIRKIDGISAIIPTIEERMLAIYQNGQMPVMVKGAGNGFGDVSRINDVIIDGEQSDDGALVSVGTAMTLNARPDFYNGLVLYAPKRVGRINTGNAAASFRTDTLRITGVYETGQKEYDADRVIIPIENARALLDYDTEATALEISVKPGSDIAKLKEQIERTVGNNYTVKNRSEQQAETFKMISIEKWITFAMLAFVLIIASFNVISTLSMLIIEKRDNISTLRSLGASSSTVGSVFAWEGWLITVLGGVGGIILGLILCYAQQWGGFIKLNGDPSQLSLQEYPVLVEWSDIGVVFGIVCVVGLVISWISSRFARNIT